MRKLYRMDWIGIFVGVLFAFVLLEGLVRHFVLHNDEPRLESMLILAGLFALFIWKSAAADLF